MNILAFFGVLLTVAVVSVAPVEISAFAQAIVSIATPAGQKVVNSKKVGNSMIVLSTKTGTVRGGLNAITISVTDKAGKPKPATVTNVNIYMPQMGAMSAMKADAKLQPAGSPGVYTGTLNVEMKGPWKVTVAFKDEKGPRRANFNIVAR